MFWLKAISMAIGVTLLQLLVWILLFLVLAALMIAWLWAKDRLWPPSPLDEQKVAALRKEMRGLQTYCWYLENAQGRRRSHLGGLPYMSEYNAWPRSGGWPLHFVAQINLADLCSNGGPDWLPTAGHLVFFVNVKSGAWAVIHEPDLGEVRQFGPPPDLPRISKTLAGYAEKPVHFRRARSWPSQERLQTAAGARENEAARQSLRVAPRPEPTHQIGGFPACVQGDWMEWELEMRLQRIESKDFGAWLKTAEAAALEPHVREWRLLLQIDSDPDTGFDWVDGGTLYFWIKERDARASDFSRVRMIGQYC